MNLNEANEYFFGERYRVLESRWAPYLQAVRETFREEGRGDPSPLVLTTTAQCLENTARWIERMDEATKAVNVGSFVNHGFELITAVMPNLISNEVFSTQPMTRRVGEVFFMKFLYGTTKGNVKSGDVMFGTDAAGNLESTYSAENIEDEKVGEGKKDGNGNPVAAFNFTVTTKPFKLIDGSVVLKWFTLDDKNNKVAHSASNVGSAFVSNEIQSSSITAETGQVSVTFQSKAEPADGTPITLSYKISFEDHPELIPEVNVQVASATVTAQSRKLRAVYSLDASYDLEQAFGRQMDTELKSAVAMEIRAELDTYNLNYAYNHATAGDFDWDPNPGAGVPYKDHKESFIDKCLIPASNALFTKTRRATGNFIVAGTEVCNVIESLAPRFKSEGKTVPGPHYIGTLDHWKVYKNPGYNPKVALVGYKGTLFLEAGLVFAPYMPIYTTRTAMLDDMMGRFGVASASGLFLVNGNFYSRVRIL